MGIERRGGEWGARVRPSGEWGVMHGASGPAWGPDGLLDRGPVGGVLLFFFSFFCFLFPFSFI